MRWPRARTRQVDGAGRAGDDRPGDDDLEPDLPLTVPERAGALAAPVAGALAGAAVSMVIGGPPGALVGAAAGPVFRYIAEADARAGVAAQRAVTQGADLAGMPPHQVADWAAADPRHLGLLIAVIEGAWRTLEDERVDVLAQVLADGARDDARVDVSTLIARALHDLGPAHVQVLQAINDGPPSPELGAKGERGWSTTHLQEHLPHLGPSVDALVSTLTARGCLIAASVMGWQTTPYYLPAEFGHACLAYLCERSPGGSDH